MLPAFVGANVCVLMAYSIPYLWVPCLYMDAQISRSTISHRYFETGVALIEPKSLLLNGLQNLPSIANLDRLVIPYQP